MEHLLSTQYHFVQSSPTVERRLESSGYEIPAELRRHVQSVTVTLVARSGNKAVRIRAASKLRAAPSALDRRDQTPEDLRNCSLSWTPACIRG